MVSLLFCVNLYVVRISMTLGLTSVLLCLRRLIYWITYRYLPNYFIPQHNMIDRMISGQSRDELLSLFHSLYDMGWGCIMLCDSLKHFSYSEISSNSRTFSTIYTEFEKSRFSSSRYITRFCDEWRIQTTCLYEEMLYKYQE